MNKLGLLLALLALGGCATCQKYPTACATAALVAGASIALSATNGRDRTTGHDYTITPINCSSGQCR